MSPGTSTGWPIERNELREAYRSGEVTDSQSSIYRNVVWMKACPDVWRRAAKTGS